jgi:hypothetical protein
MREVDVGCDGGVLGTFWCSRPSMLQFGDKE